MLNYPEELVAYRSTQLLAGTTLAVLLAAVACGTGPALAPANGTPPPADLGPLPEDTRAAAALVTLGGASYDAAGPGATPEDSALRLNAASTDCSWARYVTSVPAENTLISLSLTVEEVVGDYWVALADYGTTGAWEWHGPLLQDERFDFDGSFERYLSPSRNLYWVVATARQHSLLVVQSAVEIAVPGLFQVPPSGQQLVAPSPCMRPSLVLMPASSGVAEEGSPVILYERMEGLQSYAYLSYYDGDSWVQRPLITDGPPMSWPRARWVGNEGLIVVYDSEAGEPGPVKGQVVEIRTDSEWQVVSEELIPGPTGDAPAGIELDYDADSEQLAVIHSYETDAGGRVYLDIGSSQSGWHVDGQQLSVGRVAGVDIAFDPGGGHPWAVYSSGDVDTSEAILIDSAVSVGRFNGVSWSFSTTDYNAPLLLDLGFSPDGTPRLLMLAGRDLHIAFPPFFELTATLYFDVVCGTYAAGDWTYDTLFESLLNLSGVLSGKLGVDAGTNVSWAGPDMLHYARAQGEIEFVTNPEFQVTDGIVTNHNHYLEGDGAGGFVESAYFTGTPGVMFSWASAPGGPACAYIRADELDVTGVLGGTFELQSDLLYWSP